jgi:hypothetical protein
MHALLQDRTGLAFPQIQLFRHTTIAALAEFLAGLAADETAAPASVAASPPSTAARSRAALRRSAQSRMDKGSRE